MTGRTHRLVIATAIGLGLCSGFASAQPADKAVRRLQLQMQQLQQQLQDAEAAKAKVEADRSAPAKELSQQSQQTGTLKSQLGRTGEQLKAAEAARAELAATVATLEKHLAEQKRSNEETLALKARELAQFTKQRDDTQSQLQARHDEQVKLVGECSAKNIRLVQLSAELLDRYRNKSVSDVVKQRDPLLGLGDVQMFNLVQDYRDKAEAERFSPAINR
jgi:chromosome segregation ATPase